MRRLTLAGISALLVLAVVAGCGGGSATPSPSGAVETEAPTVTDAPLETLAPEPVATDAPTAAATGTVFYAACANVAVREGPAADEGLVIRLTKGTKVRVVETVTGAAYDAGSCGESGDQWLKITKIAGKSVQKQYDRDAVYAAAGFFGEGQP